MTASPDEVLVRSAVRPAPPRSVDQIDCESLSALPVRTVTLFDFHSGPFRFCGRMIFVCRCRHLVVVGVFHMIGPGLRSPT
jgi:hypothetical protein